MRSVPKTRIQADILIQQDILAFLNAGGHIVYRKPRKVKGKASKALTLALSHVVKL